MNLWFKVLRKYQKITVLVLTTIITASLITITAEMGNLLQNYMWRMFTYVVFAIVFFLIMAYREELFKNGR